MLNDKIFFIDVESESETRFDMAKFFRFTDNADPITSKFVEDLKKLNPGGTYRITGNEFRPDRISYAIYQNFQYWWVLMVYNDILKVEDLTSGVTIVYPVIDDLEDIYFTLKTQEISQ